jgi:hypothetical protein
MLHEMVAIEHGVHRADGRQMRPGKLLPQLLADFGRAPARIFPLQADNRGLNRRRQPIRLPMRAMAPIAKGLHAAVLIAVENLVARLPRNPELGAQRRHLLALKQAGDKPESLIHDVTLLPRHARPLPGRGQSVTHPLGICCYLTLRKDTVRSKRALGRGPLFCTVDRFATCREATTRRGSLRPAVSTDILHLRARVLVT